MNPDTQQLIEIIRGEPLPEGFEPLSKKLSPAAASLLKWAKKKRKRRRKAIRKARKRNWR